MKRATLFFAAVFVLGSMSCISQALPDGDGGTLFPTKKSALDGFFLWGGLKYVEKNLKVRTWKEPAESTTRMFIEYKNIGKDGVRLKVTCRWSLDGHNSLGDPEYYDETLFPFSKYLIRRTGWQASQKHLIYSCDHKDTLEPLYNRELLLNRGK